MFIKARQTIKSSLFTLHFNNVSTSYSFPICFFHLDFQNVISYEYHIRNACYMSRPYRSPWFYYPNTIRWKVHSKARKFVIFSSLLLSLHPVSCIQIFSSSPYSETPSKFLPLICVTKYHIHMKHIPIMSATTNQAPFVLPRIYYLFLYKRPWAIYASFKSRHSRTRSLHVDVVGICSTAYSYWLQCKCHIHRHLSRF